MFKNPFENLFTRNTPMYSSQSYANDYETMKKEVEDMMKESSKLFEETFNTEMFNSAEGKMEPTALMNIRQKSDGYVVEVSLPGFNKNQVKVTQIEDSVGKIQVQVLASKKNADPQYAGIDPTSYSLQVFNTEYCTLQFNFSGEKDIVEEIKSVKMENGLLEIFVEKYKKDITNSKNKSFNVE
jgi:HSP20 family molecular chaperone IbpA